MRYTIAAFGIMASAVFAVPMATDVVARGSGDDADDWKDWGYTSSDDWKKKGGVSTLAGQVCLPVHEGDAQTSAACSDVFLVL
jgi:hypothetical protein